MTVVAGSSKARTDRPGRRGGGPGRAQATPGRCLLAGLLAALRAFVTGLLVCMVVGLLLDASGEGPSFGGTVGLGGDVWLAAHQVPLIMPHGPMSLLPIGLVALPAVVLFRAGRRLTRDAEVRGLRSAALAVGALAVPYACGGLLVALSTLAQPEHASLVWAPVGTGLLAAAAGGPGVLRGTGLGRRVAGLLPVWCRPTLVAASGAAAALVAVGALLVAVMLAVHVVQVHEITASLSAGVLGGALLFLTGVAYVPNAVVFAIGYAAGPGFSLGGGTVIAPGLVDAGPVPAFPLLAAVPADATPAAWGVLAGPVLAGVVAGTLLVRHTLPRTFPRAALGGLAAGPAVGVLVAALGLVAGGALGAGRLAWLGPSPVITGLAVAAEVGVPAAVTATVCTWLARRRETAGATESG